MPNITEMEIITFALMMVHLKIVIMREYRRWLRRIIFIDKIAYLGHF